MLTLKASFNPLYKCLKSDMHFFLFIVDTDGWDFWNGECLMQRVDKCLMQRFDAK